VDVREPHAWPVDVAEATALQLALRPLVRLESELAEPVRRVAGLDVTYDKSSSRAAAAVVVMAADDFSVVEEQVVVHTVDFPYAPGLFAFRELPPLVKALRKISAVPDVLLCDGHGIAHPRGFGLACHLGLLTGLPAVGVAKTILVGDFSPLAAERGAREPIVDQGETVGFALRTSTNVKPVFVSPGHLVTFDDAVRLALRCSPSYRLPEPIRRADHISRQVLRS
jgi:deoxyribonuclease V